MIIDDSVDHLKLMKSVCAMVDPTLRVVTADSGDMAFRYLQSQSHDLPKVILLDLKMPGKSGLEVLSDLKSDSLLRRIPVCIFSSADIESEICDCYERGASLYFRKPSGLTDLKSFLEHFRMIWFTFASYCAH